ncbi:MAG: hypothetical protein ABIG42_11775 [bacterium]
MNLIYLIAFVLALSGWGMLPYLKLVRTERPVLERFLIIQAIGFTMTWLFVFLICALKILHPTWIHLWGFAGLIIYSVKFRAKAFNGGWWEDLLSGFNCRNQRAFALMLASLAILAYVIFLYFSHAPTTTWDPLDYHYVLPREWLQNGGFVNLPKLMYSNFPASVELIWLCGMALMGDIIANHFTWWFGFLLGLTLLHIGRQWFINLSGWIGLVLFLALPIVYTEEIPGGVIDLAVFTFNLLTIHFALLYTRHERTEDAVFAWLFASNSLAMKHSSVLSLVFAVIAIAYVFYKKGNFAKGIKASALLFICAFILPLLWYVKSFVYTGNPVYPFLNSVFNPSSKLSVDILYWSNPNFTRDFLDWLTYWYDVITDVGMVQFRFRLINGIYLGMLPFIYWVIRKPGWHRGFIAYSFFMIFLLLYNAPGEPRYQLAAWGVLGIALAMGLYESGIMRDSTMRRLIPLALIVPITVMMIMCIHENRNRHGFILGKDSSRDYYMKNVGVYPLIDYMNTETPEDSLVIWCDPRVYLFEREYIPAYPFDTGNLPSWENDAISIVKKWQEMGVTHLGFTSAANYRAWMVVVILEQAEIDDVNSGVVFIEDQFAPGYKYEEGRKLDFSPHPMDRRVQRLGPLTPRAMQLASYATNGIERVFKDGEWFYKADLEILLKERADDIDVKMIRKLLEIGNMKFLSPVETVQTEGILFELNYARLDMFDSDDLGGGG